MGRLGCGGTREGVLGRTGAVVASASIATSGRRSGGADKDERQEDVAGDATARQVARVVCGRIYARPVRCRGTRGTFDEAAVDPVRGGIAGGFLRCHPPLVALHAIAREYEQ